MGGPGRGRSPPPRPSELGAEPTTVALAVTGERVSEQQEEDINEGLAAISSNASMYVERGYQADDDTVIAQMVLIALGGVLMLGGTLTATFLALSDARPDLATLSAVGASPAPGAASPRRTPWWSAWSARCWAPPSGSSRASR